MATYSIRANGRVQAKIRRLGVSLSDVFDTLEDAQKWANRTEAEIIKSEQPRLTLLALSPQEVDAVLNFRHSQKANQ